jgi:Ca-activated chloride channel homolog
MAKVLLWIGLCLHAQEPFRIKVDVDLVLLHATVRDRDGRLVPDLHERDVEISEDGARQSVRLFKHEDSPVTAGLVVDHSGSMKNKLADVVAGARRFARASHPLDQMFVVNFNEHVTMPQPSLEQFSSRSDELERAIATAPPAGKTALYDAIAAGLERLQSGSRDKRVLVVFSDGGDNASSHSLADVLRMAALSSAVIYTIGVFDSEDPDRNPGVLKQLAKATGGEAFFPERLTDIVAVCDRIALDIRQHYTIGFVSSNVARDGAYRSIRLVARQAGRKHSVRVRAGYIAGSK